MSDEILRAKLEAFKQHRANAAKIAMERGGQFGYMPGHPHDVLDAADSVVREYFHEVNASITALHEAGISSGSKKPDEKPELLEPHVCECCKKLVIPVPEDLRRGQPIGSIQMTSPLYGPAGRPRREAVYDREPWPQEPSWATKSFADFAKREPFRKDTP